MHKTECYRQLTSSSALMKGQTAPCPVKRIKTLSSPTKQHLQFNKYYAGESTAGKAGNIGTSGNTSRQCNTHRKRNTSALYNIRREGNTTKSYNTSMEGNTIREHITNKWGNISKEGNTKRECDNRRE